MMTSLTICLQISSADKLCNQFRPRAEPTKGRSLSESKLIATLIVLLKFFFKKDDFEKKNSPDNEKKRAKSLLLDVWTSIVWYLSHCLNELAHPHNM